MVHGPGSSRAATDPSDGGTRWQPLGLLIALLASLAIGIAPAPAGLPPAAQWLAGTTVLMTVLWVSQAIPIAATALIPLAAYPLLGIQSAETVSQSYMNANIFLFFGGFIIALGIERWGLHRRIALHVVHVVGSSPRLIVLGFMGATAFLSMWISNTATTMLMLPIAIALLRTLAEVSSASSAEPEGDDPAARGLEHLGVGLMLGIAYSASCGGLATLVGTPTNIAYLGQWGELFPEAPQPSMAEWIVVFLPLSLLMIAVAFLLLTWRLPPRIGAFDVGRRFFGERLKALGRPSAGECAMLCVFVATAVLWITREPIEFQLSGREAPLTLVTGWSPAYERFVVDWLGADPGLADGAVQDATVAMLMALLLFVIPVPVASGHRQPLIDWDTVERGMPWGMVVLFGGGFAIASAFASTGLSAWLGATLAESLQEASLPVLVLCVCLLMTFLTEFTSNVATVSALLPILAGASVTLGIDPRLIMIPATVTASCAFMLPIATPPNTIVFASGRVTMRQMARYGVLLNLIGVALVTLVTFVLLVPVMQIDVDRLPDWAFQN